ncbi:hypothetical protein NC651_024843 [Populus alba x Populus x berolinensis]|nr:hypothetical protein NC651_024843 [Populus alba x Populus x berolinensis]
MLLSPPAFILFPFLVFFLSAFFFISIFWFPSSTPLILSLSTSTSLSFLCFFFFVFRLLSLVLPRSRLRPLSCVILGFVAYLPLFPYSFAVPRFVLLFSSWFLALFFPASPFSFFVFPSVQPLWFFAFFWGFLFFSLFSPPRPLFVVFYGFYERLASIRAFVPHDREARSSLFL